MEITEWFEPHTKPTLVGVYEVRWGEHIPIYRYWNGTFWRVGCDTIAKAIRRSNVACFHQNISWRGLAKDPNLK